MTDSAPDALRERLSALEDRIAALEARQPDIAADPAPADPAPGGPAAPHGSEATPHGSETPAPPAVDPARSSLWALEGLKQATGGAGGILFTGDLPQTPAGPVSWQYGRPAGYIDDLDFTAAATRLDALGHPVRLGLLQEIYLGTTSVAGLSELGRFGSTGQIYHHLQQLASAGWLESPQRGQWRIPVKRVIPVLTIIIAAVG